MLWINLEKNNGLSLTWWIVFPLSLAVTKLVWTFWVYITGSLVWRLFVVATFPPLCVTRSYWVQFFWKLFTIFWACQTNRKQNTRLTLLIYLFWIETKLLGWFQFGDPCVRNSLGLLMFTLPSDSYWLWGDVCLVSNYPKLPNTTCWFLLSVFSKVVYSTLLTAFLCSSWIAWKSWRSSLKDKF
jgi:hypothetical protein